MIEYTETINSFYELKNKLSNSALLDLEEIEERHLEEELIEFLSEMTWNNFTEIDDFIDYEMDYILETLKDIYGYGEFMANIDGEYEEESDEQMKYSLYKGFTTIFEDDERLFNELLLEDVSLQEIIDYLTNNEKVIVYEETLKQLNLKHKATIERKREQNKCGEYYLDTFTIIKEESEE